MAAGAGRRFGHRPKSLLQRDGRALVVRQLQLLADAGVHHAVVVLGHHAGQIEPVLLAAAPRLAPLQLGWVRNPDPDAGPGGSLRCGLAALPPALDAVLVLLGDQPLLTAQDITDTVAAWRARAPGIELVVPVFDGQPGHPLAFGPVVRRAVMQEQGGAGVKEWRRAHPAQTQLLAAADGRCIVDIDSEADIASLALTHGVCLRWPGDAP